MKIISHRGNLEGIQPKYENSPEYVQEAIDAGFDVEIDVWFDYQNHKWWLGHDYPKYKVTFDFLQDNSQNLWCHCKDVLTFSNIILNSSLEAFMHDQDLVARTTKGHFWTYRNGQLLPEFSVAVMPEHACNNWNIGDIKECHGVCTDYPIHYKNLLK